MRFFIDQSVTTTRIGGHFVKNTLADNSFFGAIVELDDEHDFPDSGDLSTSDVVGSTLLTFPEPSDEVFGDLAKQLESGWYALVFGSGLFGATGSGGAVRNGIDIGTPTYIGSQSGADWFNLTDLSDVVEFTNHRFIIEGSMVPESASLGLLLIAALCFMFRRPVHMGE